MCSCWMGEVFAVNTKKPDCSGFFHLFNMTEILSSAVCIARKAVGYPHLDQRLAAHAQVAGLGIKGVHHPDRKVHINPLRLLVGPAGRCPVHMAGNVFASVKAAVKFLG